MIEVVPIAENRYAPDGLRNINLYNVDEGQNLTFAQLMAFVCLQAGAFYEARSIQKLNRLSSITQVIDVASPCLQQLASGEVEDWESMKDFLVNTMGISESALPEDVTTYERRMQAVKALKEALEQQTSQAQEDMIDVQSLMSHWNVALSTSSNLISATGKSKLNAAQAF